MAAWAISDAITSLRSALGDTPTDKFIFKAKCFPTADGVTTRFFVGDTRLISPTLDVFVDRVLLTSGYSVDWEKGTFDVTGYPAPAANVSVDASYYSQWFTDSELTEFLTLASNSVNVPTIDDTGLPVFARGAVLDFACYYAYMFKAAEYASGLQASAEGFIIDKSRPSPNWKALAQLAWEKGQKNLNQAKENPLSLNVPTMRFVAYRLPVYIQ